MNVRQNLSCGQKRSTTSGSVEYRWTSEGTEPVLWGNAAALESLRPTVREYIRRKFGSAIGAGVDDVLQETMVAGWKALTTGAIRGSMGTRPENHLRHWLLESARRRSLFELRPYQRQEAFPEDIAALSTPADELVAARQLLARIAAEPSADMAVLLDYAQGELIGEIAKRLGKCDDAISNAIKRARCCIANQRRFPRG